MSDSLHWDGVVGRAGRSLSETQTPWLLPAATTPSRVDAVSEVYSDDIILVVTHFAETVRADGWALTFAADPDPATCLAQEGLEHDQIDAIIRLTTQNLSLSINGSAAPVWMEALGASCPASALIFPSCSSNAGTCVVTLVFADGNADGRLEIERLGTRHWPPVAAYLRLWLAAHVERYRMDGIEAGLNLVEIGVVLLSDDGLIVFANDAARALIDGHDGIREHRGRLQATNRSDMTLLSNAIGYALSGSDTADHARHMPLLTLNRREGPPLVATFMSTPRRSVDARPNGALAFFIDPGLDIRQLAEPVCKLFHLSRVETELACLLASGQTLASAAQSLHVKIDTARGYLKNIFLKTGKNRQVDLVRLIFSNLIRTHC